MSVSPRLDLVGIVTSHPVALAFDFGTPAALDKAYARVAAEFSGHKEPFDAVWGQRYAYFSTRTAIR